LPPRVPPVVIVVAVIAFWISLVAHFRDVEEKSGKTTNGGDSGRRAPARRSARDVVRTINDDAQPSECPYVRPRAWKSICAPVAGDHAARYRLIHG
jgi:hypothetical protein